MPELPEVENIRRSLAKRVIGQTIKSVTLNRGGLREAFPPRMAARLKNQTIVTTARRGKYLILSGQELHWIVHFGMSGNFALAAQPSDNKHAHVIARFHSGDCLSYIDPRRFGRMTLTNAPYQHHPWLAAMGVEPLAAGFSARHLQTLLQNKSTSIKAALLDSRLVAGIGNIYACEALYAAGISPLAAAHALTPPRLKKLHAAIRQVLRAAIKSGGSTIRDFADIDGESGYFQMKWQVYGRGNLPCRRCSRPVRRITQNGRSSFFCTRCQQ